MKKIGEFYKVKDRNGGHPAQIYKINIENSEYYIVRFSHQDRKDRIKLTHNIDPNSLDDCFIIKNPQIVPYSDLKANPKYLNFRIHPDDADIVQKIKNKKWHPRVAKASLCGMSLQLLNTKNQKKSRIIEIIMLIYHLYMVEY